MRKKYLCLLFLPFIVACAGGESSSSTSSLESQTSSATSIVSSSSQEETNISDFSFTDNGDGTLSISKYNNYRPARVVIPETYQGKNITGILENAFSSSGGVETIVFSKNIVNYSSSTFASCFTIKSIEVDEANPTFKSEDGFLLSKDGSTLCYCPSAITEVSIPNTITVIGERAFNYSRATSITLPEGIESIGERAFATTPRLQSIVIPNTVVSIGEYAFNLSGIRSITLGTSLQTLSPYAISNCSNLTRLEIPGNVKTIGDSAICNNGHLETIVIHEGVEEIGVGGFADNATKSVEFPTSLKTIGQYAFIRNSVLEEVVLKDGLETIGEEAFSYCPNLRNFSISKTVRTIGTSFIAYASSLRTITVDEENPYFKDENGALYSKDGKRILAYALDSAPTSFVIAPGVERIERNVFALAVRLQSVTIPASTTFIGAFQFRESAVLTTVHYGGQQADWEAIIKSEIIDETEVFWNDLSVVSSVVCQDGVINIA